MSFPFLTVTAVRKVTTTGSSHILVHTRVYAHGIDFSSWQFSNANFHSIFKGTRRHDIQMTSRSFIGLIEMGVWGGHKSSSLVMWVCQKPMKAPPCRPPLRPQSDLFLSLPAQRLKTSFFQALLTLGGMLILEGKQSYTRIYSHSPSCSNSLNFSPPVTKIFTSYCTHSSMTSFWFCL